MLFWLKEEMAPQEFTRRLATVITHVGKWRFFKILPFTNGGWGRCLGPSLPQPLTAALRWPWVWTSLPWVLLCNGHPWSSALAALGSAASGGAGVGCGAGVFTRQLPTLLNPTPRAPWRLGSVTRCWPRARVASCVVIDAIRKEKEQEEGRPVLSSRNCCQDTGVRGAEVRSTVEGLCAVLLPGLSFGSAAWRCRPISGETHSETSARPGRLSSFNPLPWVKKGEQNIHAFFLK